jgi:hypothetical protein
MQKVLGQDIKDMDERRQFLLDNADEVVEMDYSKAFDADELAKKKTELAEKSIRINDLNEAVKDYKAEVNLELKPLKEEVKNLLGDIKAKSRIVTEKCYKIVDEDERMACFYNAEGVLVSSRPATKEELSPTIFKEIRKAE